MNGITGGIVGFREGYLHAESDGGGDFTDVEARRLRYALLWALYLHSVYRSNVHNWSATFRQQYALYRYIREIEAPTGQIASFWQTHLMGGALDFAAGDGEGTPSALPILTETEALRPALAQLWQWSNWQTRKDTFGLHGSVLGDVGLRVVDDVARAKVYLQLVHPSCITALDLDPFGNVKAYTIEETREHPVTGKAVIYREEVTREGDNTVYRTFVDKQAYAWPENLDKSGDARQQWSEPYTFIPLVWCKHIDIGGDFGLSELHQGLPIFRELDDIGSALDDQIRKTVNAPWFFAGVDDPKLRSGGTDPSIAGASPSATRPQPGRQEAPILYGPAGATATPLVMPLDIVGANARIEQLHGKLRREYPELEADITTSAGDASGRALRVARQKAETKVILRRAAYDDALVRAQAMAVAIGGWRKLEGFRGFNLDSYSKGALDHRIGPRPVFAVTTADEIEEETAFWLMVKGATDAGADLRGYLEDKGWQQERIDRVAPEKADPVVPGVTLPGGAGLGDMQGEGADERA